METSITLLGLEINITATRTGSKMSPWDKKNVNHHLINVSCNGKRLQFDYWASLAFPVIDKTVELVDAFHCFITDSLSVNDSSLEDFCAELYDGDIKSGKRAYNACVKSLAKYDRVFDEIDIYDMATAIAELLEEL